ncbi:MAG: TIR domain-containing protein, partial (plasmid) [Candidatus Methanoperedens sp.]
MARKVFFSFHYKKDNWRAGQVRNSWVTKPDRDSAGFWDSAEWENVKRQGDVAVKRWIDRQLEGTSVTVVLIGSQTASRKWIRYEIQKSYEKGNGIVGIRIHQNKDQNGHIDE